MKVSEPEAEFPFEGVVMLRGAGQVIMGLSMSETFTRRVHDAVLGPGATAVSDTLHETTVLPTPKMELEAGTHEVPVAATATLSLAVAEYVAGAVANPTVVLRRTVAGQVMLGGQLSTVVTVYVQLLRLRAASKTMHWIGITVLGRKMLLAGPPVHELLNTPTLSEALVVRGQVKVAVAALLVLIVVEVQVTLGGSLSVTRTLRVQAAMRLFESTAMQVMLLTPRLRFRDRALALAVSAGLTATPFR